MHWNTIAGEQQLPAARTARARIGGGIPQRLLAVLALTTSTAVAGPTHPSVDVTPRPAPTVAPGTVIGKTAPRGWSDLVIKSSSRIDPSQVSKVSQHELKYSKLFSTCIVADIRQERTVSGGADYALKRVGVGCLTTIRHNDTVVSPSSHKKLGADLGILGGRLLGEICKKQQSVMVVAKSSTMAVIDTPVVVYYQKANRPLAFRYILLVDQDSGKLHRGVFLINPAGKNAADRILSHMELLDDDHVQEFPLFVDTDAYYFGFPTEAAFGVIGLPQGTRQFAIADAWKESFGAGTYSRDVFRALEHNLRTLLTPPRPAKQVNHLQPVPQATTPRSVSPPPLRNPPPPARDNSLDARRARMRQPVLRQRIDP